MLCVVVYMLEVVGRVSHAVYRVLIGISHYGAWLAE